MHIINEIRKSLEWYKNNLTSQDVDMFIKLRDKLAINSFYLAELVADQKLDYNKDYFMRQISVSKSVQTMVKNGMSVTQAKNDAIAINEKIYLKEQESEANAYRMDLLIRQVNRVLDALGQKISYLRKEAEHSKSLI